MSISRQAKVRSSALGVAALGMALWIASMALPIVFGEDRGWSEEDSQAYHSAGKRLHDLLEGSHDHDEQLQFDDESAAEAYAELQRQKRRVHIQVDPRDLAQAQMVFDDQRGRLQTARDANRRQYGLLFWGGIALMAVGGVSFFAANRADD